MHYNGSNNIIQKLCQLVSVIPKTLPSKGVIRKKRTKWNVQNWWFMSANLVLYNVISLLSLIRIQSGMSGHIGKMPFSLRGRIVYNANIDHVRVINEVTHSLRTTKSRYEQLLCQNWRRCYKSIMEHVERTRKWPTQFAIACWLTWMRHPWLKSVQFTRGQKRNGTIKVKVCEFNASLSFSRRGSY